MAISRPDTAQLKAAFQSLRQAMGYLEDIRRDSKALEKDIRKAADALAERQLDEFLSGMSVDELSRDKRGIRISALKNAGIENLGQLHRRSRAALESIEGIGQANAALIHSTVRTIAGTARESMHLRLSAEDKSKELSRLLPLLHRYSAAAQPRMAAEELLADFGDEVDIALSVSKKALSPLAWLFSSAADKKMPLPPPRMCWHSAAAALLTRPPLSTPTSGRAAPEAKLWRLSEKTALHLPSPWNMSAAWTLPAAAPALFLRSLLRR